MYVESAEKVSDRRANANSFFISLNTLIATIVGYASSQDKLSVEFMVLLMSVGLLSSILWYRLIISYRQLNAAKFQIIQNLEKDLPIQLYEVEWEILKTKDKTKFITFTGIEKFVPVIFSLLFVFVVVLKIFVS